MKISTTRRSRLWIAAFTLVLVIALPATAIGQGHGRWERGRNFDKKCGKFVNCHDARDGRRDRRRFRRDRITLNDRGFFRRGRHHDRNFDDDNFFRQRRIIRDRDRDFPNDDHFLRHRRGRHHDDD